MKEVYILSSDCLNRYSRKDKPFQLLVTEAMLGKDIKWLEEFKKSQNYQILVEHISFLFIKRDMGHFANRKREEWGLLESYQLIGDFALAKTTGEFELIHRYYYWCYLHGFHDQEINFPTDIIISNWYIGKNSKDFFDVVAQMPPAGFIRSNTFDAFKEKGIDFKYYFEYLNNMYEIVTACDEQTWREDFLGKSFEKIDTLFSYIKQFHMEISAELKKRKSIEPEK